MQEFWVGGGFFFVFLGGFFFCFLFKTRVHEMADVLGSDFEVDDLVLCHY